MANSFHIIPHEDGWAVKKEGVERHHSTHETQKAAIDTARDIAKEGDELVVHRTDGTVREAVTVSGANAAATRANGGRDLDADRPRFHDIWSVGSRVSWSAIVGGAVVALATAALLTAFAVAVQIPMLDSLKPQDNATIAGIGMLVIVLAALFLGGFVASRLTTRETLAETVIYGVLVWGTVAALSTLGIGAGTRLGLDVFNTARNDNRASDQAGASRTTAEGRDLTGERARNPDEDVKAQRAKETTASAAEGIRSLSPAGRAWWAFGALALSLLVSIGGALAGCGEDPTRRIRRDELPPVQVENRLTQYERTGA
jgi:Uncharacterized protein conserved in bacteria (DUF2188)